MSNIPNDKETSPNNQNTHTPNEEHLPPKEQPVTSSDSSNFSTISFKGISDPELEIHLKLVKLWLVKYNTFEYDNQSTSKLTALHLDDIKIILNHKKNFARIKLYVDYIELEHYCPNFAISLKKSFCKYYNYLTFLTKKILITSKKIKEDSSVFADFILLNYPFIHNELSQHFFVKLINKTKSGILSFSKCYVIKVNTPIYLLWCKKVYPKCSCSVNEKEISNETASEKSNFSNKKYFDIFKKNIKYNSAFNESSLCSKCSCEYYHDTKSDIFIECQEIQIAIDSEEGFMNNIITVWAFGDLINSVKESDCISMSVFYIPEKVNCLEKNFSYGYAIVLNFNIFFIPLQLLNVDNFSWNESQDNKNENDKSNQNLIDTFFQRKNKETEISNNNNNNFNIKNELKTIRFQKQLNITFYKFILQNYTFHKINELSNNINTETSFPFLNIILDLSIAQRDYVNHLEKINFLQINNADYFQEQLNNEQHNKIQLLFKTKTKIKEKNSGLRSNYEKSLTASRNLVFKTKLFTNNANINKQQLTNENNNNNRICIHHNSDSLKNEFKKYFRLSKQMNFSTSSINELLIKPLNLFMIFDSTINDPIIYELNKYIEITSLNKLPLIMPYPVFTQKKIDKDTLTNFYIRSKNKIVVINDIDILSKQEIDFISNMITSSNNTFWFCCNYSRLNDICCSNTNMKNGKNIYNVNTDSNISQLKVKGFEKIMQYCEIVINFSKRKAKMKTNIDIINEMTINNFLNDMNKTYINEQQMLLWYNKYGILKEKINTKCKEYHFYNSNNNEKVINDEFGNSFASAKLIEDYFIAKRNIMKITFDDLFLLLRLAIFNSMLRSLYEQRKINVNSMLSNINYVDSIFAIILYEEICGYKYGIEAKSFNSITEKILLRDYNEEINIIINNIQGIAKVKTNKNEHIRAIPKSKTIKKMNFLDEQSDNFGMIDRLGNKPINEQCILCKEIDKIHGSKDLLCDLIERLNNFTYEQFETEFYG